MDAFCFFATLRGSRRHPRLTEFVLAEEEQVRTNATVAPGNIRTDHEQQNGHPK